MKEQLISFETAKLAKEKGFKLSEENKPILEIYEDGKLIYDSDGFVSSSNAIIYSPTQSLLQKWLRDKHETILFVLYMKIDVYYYQLYKKGSEKLPLYPTNGFDTYEEALEKGLQEALKLLT